ncbi:neprilysin-2 isoform X1 [Parasteatoda tepidariorum]|uniref:neprilysin-2 isoform X2 n=1 Tax=Parasteatoda tepidariorum TaxID=114398 RepID=UPI001C71AD08|nr:neprilysin-2 isoform X2 [Parasteatoda tepidariorum]
MFSISSRKHFYSSKFDMNPHWWNRRTRLERILCFVTITTLLILLMMAATFAVFGYSYQTDAEKSAFVPSESRRFARQVNAEEVCNTPGCIETAEKIKQNLDESVDPCDNFYKFACGNWIKTHPIREDRPESSVFYDVDDELSAQLKGLVNKPLDGTEPKNIKIVKDFYDSCMNLDGIENSGSQPLQTVLTTLGGWPAVVGDSWDGSTFDWMETLFKMRNLGYDHSILITTSVSTDFKNSTVHTIEMDQTSLGMPNREYYMKGLNDSATQAYFNLMVKAAKKLGANEKTVENELLQALNFEITLANNSLPDEERRDFDKMYHKYTIPQLRELVSQIDWIKYFNGLVADPITETETVLVDVPDFLKKFGELITTTDKRVVANYMMWRVVGESLGSLSKDWRALKHEYSSALSGESAEKPRWETCLRSVNGHLGIAVSSYYIKHYFKGDSKQKALEMVGYLSKEFLNILNDIDWMDSETKKLAKEKVNSITPYIGYPQELLNDSIVSDYYKALTVANENYFSNVLNIKKWKVDEEVSKLRKPFIKKEWKAHADIAMVNAFFNFFENTIDFPAGILQNAFFNKDRPTYMNFGAIGYVIGHEITHGFDDMGKQFDKEGNNVNWWDQATIDNFNEKANCIIYQYGNYTTENGLSVNGITTQGENIADNGGMKEAYRAYHAWVRDNGPEKKLPGLKYSPSQLFWISSASVWCANYRPEQLKLMILSDPHSPGEFRVNGPMSNLKEFSAAFACGTETKMNPDHKCQVW